MESYLRLLFKRRTFLYAFSFLLLYGFFIFIFMEYNISKKHLLLKILNYRIFIDQDGNSNQEDVFFKSHPERISLTPIVTSAYNIFTSGESSFTQTKDDPEDSCPHLGIHPKIKQKSQNLRCLQHQPSQSGCKYATENYVYDIKKRTCKTDPRLKICGFNKNALTCSYSGCGKHFRGEIVVHTFNPKSGIVEAIPEGSFDSKTLKKTVMKYARITVRRGYNFMFISCGEDVTQTDIDFR